MANKFINELNGIESVAVGDELPIWDSSENDTRKTTVSKLSSALTVNLVSEGISAPPSSNAVAIAIQNVNAVLHVETLPTSPNIKNVIYHNTTDGKYYVGNKTTQATSELNTDSVQYVDSLPVSPNIENLIYAITAPSGKYKFYAGDKENQTTQELGGSGAIFTGTQAEWDALTTAEKNEYSQANITDANSVVHVPVDIIADGNMNPVTSNAVYDAMNTVESTTINLALSSTIKSAYLPFALKKTGKIVVANGLRQGITDWGTLVTNWGQIATIPSGFRPSSDIIFHILSSDGNRYSVRINATGVVSGYNHSGGGLGFETSANCSWTTE